MTSPARTLHQGARRLRQQGEGDLAALLEAISVAHTSSRRAEVPSIEEAQRWAPVVDAAYGLLIDWT